jgi:hypothetical protein
MHAPPLVESKFPKLLIDRLREIGGLLLDAGTPADRFVCKGSRRC